MSKKKTPEKCKDCYVTEMAKDRGLTLFVCKGVKDVAFCNCHREPK